jgi:NAD(P)-dependent dehydrogenase (short-subunit alcohol dehydrogenase family)
MSNNKIALITGGSRGLGREMALNVAKKGNDVVITYLSNKDKAETVVKEIQALGRKAYAMQLDARSTNHFDTFLTELAATLQSDRETDKIDFLINNAGTGIYKPFLETTEADFDEMMNVHLKGVYFLTQKVIPYLNDGGRIINISSGLARFSLPGSSAYASMKGGIDVFTRFLAKELAPRKISAISVAPGAIATDFGDGENKSDHKQTIISNATALGRVGEPEDIGGVIGFLCSDDSRWINGQRIEVSGGIFL